MRWSKHLFSEWLILNQHDGRGQKRDESTSSHGALAAATQRGITLDGRSASRARNSIQVIQGLDDAASVPKVNEHKVRNGSPLPLAKLEVLSKVAVCRGARVVNNLNVAQIGEVGPRHNGLVLEVVH